MPAKKTPPAVTEMIECSTPASSPDAPPNQRRPLALVNELPLLFAQETALEPLLQRITERLVESIPSATRAAMLLTDRASGKLLLKAHFPSAAHRYSPVPGK